MSRRGVCEYRTVEIALMTLAVVAMLAVISLILAARPVSAQGDVIHINTDIDGDEVWTPDHIYVVDEDVTVIRGVTLTIEPGTIVKFASQADLTIMGRLAVGEAPMFYTLHLPLVSRHGGTSPAATVRSLSARPLQADEPVYFTSLLDDDDAVGGDTNEDGDATAPAQGDWGGIVFDQDQDQPRSHMNGFVVRYSGNPTGSLQQGAILLQGPAPYLAAAAFENNYINGAEIERRNLLDDTWDSREVVYHVTGEVTLLSANTLRILPGVTVKFAERMYLEIEGTLQAMGASTRPIILTSLYDDEAGGDTNNDGDATAPAVKDWGGVRFAETSHPTPGTMTHTEIRYSGTGNVAAIRLENASPRLAHVTFVDNYLNGAQLVAERDELQTLTLDSASVPYVVRDDLQVPVNETLTIEPGVTLKFSLNSSLHVYGVLDAVGSAPAPIVMTSIKDDAALGDTNNDAQRTAPAAGDWGCVFVAQTSDDAACRMDRVHLRYAGRDSLEFSSRIGAIRLDNASPTLTRITFDSNSINAVEIPTGDWLSDVWDNTGVVYFITGDLRIPSGETLAIAPGVIVKVANPVSPTTPPEVRVEGALQAGVLGSTPVVWTSGRNDQVGPSGVDNWDSNGDGTLTAPEIDDWVGITFAPGADPASYLRNVVVTYGGRSEGTFQEPHAAVRLEGVDLGIEACQFLQNYRAVAARNGAQPTITGCRFEENEEYAVYNGAPDQVTVPAQNNWWGAANGPRSDGEPCNTATGFGQMVSCGVAFQPWLVTWP